MAELFGFSIQRASKDVGPREKTFTDPTPDDEILHVDSGIPSMATWWNMMMKLTRNISELERKSTNDGNTLHASKPSLTFLSFFLFQNLKFSIIYGWVTSPFLRYCSLTSGSTCSKMNLRVSSKSGIFLISNLAPSLKKQHMSPSPKSRLTVRISTISG